MERIFYGWTRDKIAMPLAPGGDPGVSIYYECTTVGLDRCEEKNA